jgi:hypothetical protein
MQMKKLLKLKKWLTVAEAAGHLSTLFEETVSEADVLRFALDGHLTLSVYFVNGARGRCGPAVRMAIEGIKRTNGQEKLNDCNNLIVDPSTREVEFSHEIGGLPLGDGRSIGYVGQTTLLDGVWDLTMLGHEKLEIEQRYQTLTEGPEVDMRFRDGPLDHPIVFREDGTYCQIHEWQNDSLRYSHRYHPAGYHPADALPADSVIVVRTSALHDLAARLSEQDQKVEKSIERRERTTLLVIIAALASIARVDLKKPSSAAQAIETQTDLMGARVAARTIENHLKIIPDALEGRSR